MKAAPVIEVFGPTVQGEGPLAGVPTHFVRFGLCDYRCSWCDSMYAVDPVEVKEHAEYLDAGVIVDRVMSLTAGPQWVTLSGGNPAMHDLEELVKELHGRRLRVAVETQASVWRDWLARVDMLVCSPKPPSSGMVSERHTAQSARFLERAQKELLPRRRALKVVVFDEDDYVWARELIAPMPHWSAFLSVGTPVPEPDPVPAILERYRWLCERVAGDMSMRHVAVLPQLHVLAWGQVRGV